VLKQLETRYLLPRLYGEVPGEFITRGYQRPNESFFRFMAATKQAVTVLQTSLSEHK
jgi:hypothetical protein